MNNPFSKNNAVINGKKSRFARISHSHLPLLRSNKPGGHTNFLLYGHEQFPVKQKITHCEPVQ